MRMVMLQERVRKRTMAAMRWILTHPRLLLRKPVHTEENRRTRVCQNVEERSTKVKVGTI